MRQSPEASSPPPGFAAIPPVSPGGTLRGPTGTVTLVFTDIEGSTRLLQVLGNAYQALLTEHQRLIRGAARACGGHEAWTSGDGFFLVFAGAGDAVAFAVAAQRRLAEHAWPAGLPVRVRMGVHTGEVELMDGQYVGLDVHRAARIASAGHGGQVLVSSTTRDIAAADLPAGVALRDLGLHRLKDLHQRERLFQVVADGLLDGFPPLQSLDALPNNLPRKLTSFVGRERELAELKARLQAASLVTIVGIGGAGKTRLALQAAADMLADFRDGAWVVELAPVSDPRQVAGAVAAALGVREYPGLSLRASVLEYLRARHLLLVLDNCEHVVAAAAEIADAVLAEAPQVRVLCTSRESLGVEGETVWRIPSLSLPDRRGSATVATVGESEAVRLFVERATAAAPGFALTDANAEVVRRICVRLDGVPLAIELAAARVKVLSVEQIAARLDDRFRLLAGGSRTAMARHQTLRAAMDWSHDLLDGAEQALLRRLSLFAGGWTLEAAEAVCADRVVPAGAVMGLLAQLVDKSLVEVRGAAEPRYEMLETVRAYGREKLVAAGEATSFRRRHLDWCVALAEQATAHLRSGDQKVWLDRLEEEWDNLQTALDWVHEDGTAEAELRLCAALWRFWYLHAHLSVGLDRLEAALHRGGAPALDRGRVLDGAAVLAFAVGDYARALEWGREALALGRELGDARIAASATLVLATASLARGAAAEAGGLAEAVLAESRASGDAWAQALALSVLGDVALDRGEYDRALALYEESVALFRRMEDAWGVALGERGKGFAARLQGDYDQAVSTQAASLAIARVLGDRTGMGSSMVQLGFLHWRQGDYDRARAVLEEALAMAREAGNRRGVADVLSVLGLVEEYEGHHDAANAALEESVAVYRDIGSRIGVASVLGTLGRVALHAGHRERAVALAEESLALFRELGDRRGAATTLRLLGEAVLYGRDYGPARRRADESLALFRELGDRWAIGYALRLLGSIALAEGDLDAADRRYTESLLLHREHGDRLGIAKCLEGLACVLAERQAYERAARLLGAADGLRHAMGAPRTALEDPTYRSCLTNLERALGPATLAPLLESGGRSADEVIAEAAGRLA